jgi:hypothetical protein
LVGEEIGEDISGNKVDRGDSGVVGPFMGDMGDIDMGDIGVMGGTKAVFEAVGEPCPRTCPSFMMIGISS